ncbi:acyltransferase family protein [Mesorhizobium sp. ORM8.1]
MAVEEQFYFLWPFAVVLMMRWLRPWAAIIVAALCVMSIYAAEHWLQSDPPFVFYMLPTRAWELLTGGLIALPVAKAMRPTQTIAELLDASGLTLITASIFLLDQDTPFPGLYALAPCVGAALIIGAGFHRQTLVSRALSIGPAAFIGLTSYSLYLRHWPLLVFAGIYRNRELFVSERVAIVMAALLVSALSWRFVERPFRRRATGWKWMAATAGSVAAVCCLSLVIINSSVFPSRGPAGSPTVQALRAERANFQASSCLQRGGLITKAGECILGSGIVAPRIVLWGDSQAAHLASALDEAARTTGVRVRQITKAGCAPFPDMRMLPASPLRADCPAFNSSALQSVLADPNITLVILAGRWNAYSGHGGSFLSKDGSWPSPGDFQCQLHVRHKRDRCRTGDPWHPNRRRWTITRSVQRCADLPPLRTS